jgi:hypothetical protein
MYCEAYEGVKTHDPVVGAGAGAGAGVWALSERDPRTKTLSRSLVVFWFMGYVRVAMNIRNGIGSIDE